MFSRDCFVMACNWRINDWPDVSEPSSLDDGPECDDTPGDPHGGHHPHVCPRQPPGGGLSPLCSQPPPASQPAPPRSRRHRPLCLPGRNAG